jgi:hypothetical protein
MLAGINQAKKSYAEFGQGSYGRYYWHGVADQAAGTISRKLLCLPLRAKIRATTLLAMGAFSSALAMR